MKISKPVSKLKTASVLKSELVDILVHNGFNWNNPVGTIKTGMNSTAVVSISEFASTIKYCVMFYVTEEGLVFEANEDLFMLNEYKAKTFSPLTENLNNFLLLWRIH